MDFGDLVFFIVFAIIIISNILKQLKKFGKKTEENKKPVKKTGLKNILETMLEEARKQMEASAGPESAGTPLKQKSGWEDIISGGDLISGQPAEAPEKVEPVKEMTPPPLISEEAARTVRKTVQPDESQFQYVETKKEKPKKSGFGEHPGYCTDAGLTGSSSQLSAQELRNAVIWSEILASPLGLRDLER
jgi:hypothetical protein